MIVLIEKVLVIVIAIVLLMVYSIDSGLHLVPLDPVSQILPTGIKASTSLCQQRRQVWIKAKETDQSINLEKDSLNRF